MSHPITKGNTNSTVAWRLTQKINWTPRPVVLAGLTVKVFGLTDLYAAWITERTTGVVVEPTYTFTADATTDRLTHVGTPVLEGDQIRVSSSGTLPTGLAASTAYFAVQVNGNTFGLATTPGGAPIDITAAGSGTHSYWIDGLVTVDWQSGDVDEVGTFRLYLNVYNSGATEYDTFPTAPQDGTKNPGYPIRIAEAA